MEFPAALFGVLLLLHSVEGQTTGSCATPSILCCLGQDNSCRRSSCYCDMECLVLTDCCSDYKITCAGNTSTTDPTEPSRASLDSTTDSNISSMPIVTTKEFSTLLTPVIFRQ
ncbi:hypothetical protein AAFF_G00006220 [Aldrovandia affinis]|uniref:SMB domain-containing protein n=1 Tax=Aldrovandia affinis TaxID=143900 RepID=A0AAD7TE86_9TELE|nr:hypothetical protein AAFF_G00006220 [Aldrovandia affinis]